MSDRYDSLSPKDLIITLRSLPRRFDSILSQATRSDRTVALITTPGPDGTSLSATVAEGARAVTVIASAATTIIRSPHPLLDQDSIDPTWTPRPGPDPSVKQAVVEISTGSVALADSLTHRSADDWARTAEITGGGQVSLVELVRDLVRRIIEVLRRSERQAAWITESAS